MLNFDSSLTSALTSHGTEAFFTLKLYYNDDSVSTNVIHISDKDRTDGSDDYFGLVSSWGSYSQSLDFFNFTTSTGNMSIKLINTDNTIEGGRFSDLFSTKNFANRKWELFLNTGRAGTYDTAARMIGVGRISGDIAYDAKTVSLTLLDYSSKYHKQLPTNTATGTPQKNVGKPIPMNYGDFHAKTGIGTVPSEFAIHEIFNKGAFPAIITDEYNPGSNSVEAEADNSTMKTLDGDNYYYYKDGLYSSMPSGNTNTGSNPTLLFHGKSAKVYMPFAGSDNDFTDNLLTLSASPGSDDNQDKFLIPISQLGDITSIQVITKLGDVGSTLGNFDYLSIAGTQYNKITVIDDALITTDVTSDFTTAQKGAWEFDGESIEYILHVVASSNTVEILNSGLEITYDLTNFESFVNNEQVEEVFTGGFAVQTQFEQESEAFSETRTVTRTKTVNTPTEIDYIYFSGKGRKYPAFIDQDSRKQGYNQNDLIENPVFIIEDILRTELGETSSTIDYDTFDTAGNTTNGYLGDIYNDAVSDIKYAFSQYKFINSKDLISRLCKQILSWVFIGGDGKFKIKTLRRTGDYSGSDKTIDFNDISLKSISRTSLGAVRNDITINYNHDYGQNQFIASVNPTPDATSTGNSVNGVGQTLKLALDADTLDSTTATQLADAYMTIFKDRKVILDFTCNRPTYNDLEIGDIVEFSNWDSNIKIYGSAMGTDYYLISSILKKPNGCSVKAIKVS